MAASAAPRAHGMISTRSAPRCKDLEADETLIVQSGKPVAIVKTHTDAPRVLIANSNLVPHWATWDHFNELDKKGLHDVRPDDSRSRGSTSEPKASCKAPTKPLPKQAASTTAARSKANGFSQAASAAWAARSLWPPSWQALLPRGRVQPDSIDFRLRTKYVDERADTLDEAMEMIDPLDRGGRGQVCRPPRQRGRCLSPKWSSARHAPRYRHRPDKRPTIRSTAICPKAGPWPNGRQNAKATQSSRKAAARAAMKVHVQGHGRFLERWRADARLRQQHPPESP